MSTTSPDHLFFNVDLVEVTRSGMTVRNRADGREHTIGFNDTAIGANEEGCGYTLILPRAVAQAQGLHYAA